MADQTGFEPTPDFVPAVDWRHTGTGELSASCSWCRGRVCAVILGPSYLRIASPCADRRADVARRMAASGGVPPLEMTSGGKPFESSPRSVWSPEVEQRVLDRLLDPLTGDPVSDGGQVD